jgi:predicted lipoprotein
VIRRRALWCLLPSAAWAQADWQRVAVPYVTAGAYLHSLYARWYAPRARELDAAARALVEAQRARCAGGELAKVRAAWIAAMTAWEKLNAVAVGPLVERRSARRIDFTPTRPASIELAIAQAQADMALVGAPAKGLPALEWLLWKSLPAPGSAACDYAVRVAADIADEASALAAAFAAPRKWNDEAQAAAFAEVLNQFVAGIEVLRWAQIERPLKEGRGQFPRAASASSAAAWAARWHALRSLSIFEAGAADAPVSLEAYLRGRGLNPLADRLRTAVQRSGLALQRASPSRPSALGGASRELTTLKRRVEAEVARALEVSIGFSDADGD